jgi:hypothetical protein
MKRFAAWMLLALPSMAMPSLSVRAEQPKDAPSSSLPLVAISGRDSHVTKPLYERISNRKDLARIWAKHVGTTVDDYYRPLFEVDFDRCLVVAIYRGEQKNTRGIEISSVSETNNLLVIRFNELFYQTAGASNDDPPDRPYALVVIPRTNKPISLQANTQSYKGQPPIWEEVARSSAVQTAEPARSKQP